MWRSKTSRRKRHKAPGAGQWILSMTNGAPGARTGRKRRAPKIVDTASRFSPATDPRFSHHGERHACGIDHTLATVVFSTLGLHFGLAFFISFWTSKKVRSGVHEIDQADTKSTAIRASPLQTSPAPSRPIPRVRCVRPDAKADQSVPRRSPSSGATTMCHRN